MHSSRGAEGKTGFPESALDQVGASLAIMLHSMLNVDFLFSLSIGVIWIFPHRGTAEAAVHGLSQQSSKQQQFQVADSILCLPIHTVSLRRESSVSFLRSWHNASSQERGRLLGNEGE